MATIYGGTMQSTWKTYLTYTVTETPTDYTITVTDVGIKMAGTTYWITFCDKDAKWSFVFGGKTYSYTEPFGDIKKTESWNSVFAYYPTNIPTKITIAKKASLQNTTVSFSINMPKWTRMKGNTGTDYGSTTSTASVTLTIPALEKPKVSLTAIRDTEIETKVSVVAQVASFVGDEISEVVIDADGTSNTFSGGIVGSAGAIMIRTTFEDLSIGQVIVTVRATGRGGSSDTYSYKVPSAFYTMDIGGKGKEIAFGCPAIDDGLPEEGLFRCSMESIFEKDLKTTGDLKIGCSQDGSGGASLRARESFLVATSNSSYYTFSHQYNRFNKALGIVNLNMYVSVSGKALTAGTWYQVGAVIPAAYRPIENVALACTHSTSATGTVMFMAYIDTAGKIYVKRSTALASTSTSGFRICGMYFV